MCKCHQYIDSLVNILKGYYKCVSYVPTCDIIYHNELLWTYWTEAGVNYCIFVLFTGLKAWMCICMTKLYGSFQACDNVFRYLFSTLWDTDPKILCRKLYLLASEIMAWCPSIVRLSGFNFSFKQLLLQNH